MIPTEIGFPHRSAHARSYIILRPVVVLYQRFNAQRRQDRQGVVSARMMDLPSSFWDPFWHGPVAVAGPLGRDVDELIMVVAA